MASFPPSRPSTSGKRDREEEIGRKEVGVQQIGEDLTPVRQQSEGSDINQMMEHNSSIHSSSVTLRNSALDTLIGGPTIWRNVGDLKISASVGGNVSGERVLGDKCSKPPLHGQGKINPSGTAHASGDVNVALAMSNISREKDNSIMSINSENYRTNMQVINGASQMPPRNKKLKIACEFHAQGWCIRGECCRFLHSNEGLDTSNRKASSSDFTRPHQSDGHECSSQRVPYILWRDGDGVSGKTPLLFGESSLHNLCTVNFGIGGQQNLIQGQRPFVSSSSNDWEPSVPFIPSHYVTQKLLMKANLRYPLHENFLLTVLKGRPTKFTFSGLGSSQILLGQRSDPKVDVSGKKDGREADLPGRKAFKEFESELIVHVKGLLEPAWLAGQVTKDDFKTIVQKSVEKVIRSFQSGQIPCSSESINLYISSSKAKLEKLVQDYLKRYKKS